MLVAVRPQRTLFEAFLEAKGAFGPNYKLVEETRDCRKNRPAAQDVAGPVGASSPRFTAPDEVVGVLTPSAAPTSLGLVLAPPVGRRSWRCSTTRPDRKAYARHAPPRTLDHFHFAHLSGEGAAAQLWSSCRVSRFTTEDARRRSVSTDKVWTGWQYGLSAQRRALPQTPDDPAIVLFLRGRRETQGVVRPAMRPVLSTSLKWEPSPTSRPRQVHDRASLFHSLRSTCGVMLPLVSGCKVFLYRARCTIASFPRSYDRDCTVLLWYVHLPGQLWEILRTLYDFGRLRWSPVPKLPKTCAIWIEVQHPHPEGLGSTECARRRRQCTDGMPRRQRWQFLPGMEAFRSSPCLASSRGRCTSGAQCDEGYTSVFD